MAVDAKNGESSEVASGVRLAVDVEFGRGRTLYILSQGEWISGFPGSPAIPGTGDVWAIEMENAPPYGVK